MKGVQPGPGSFPRPPRIEDLQDPALAEEALAHWDELDPEVLDAIAGHPQHGPRLAMLRKAERWLAEGRGAAEETCPSSEELYDYGRGPGYGPLPSARRAEIERHLTRCGECEGYVETLAFPPPVPVDVPSSRPVLNRIPAPARGPRPGPAPILEEATAHRRLRRVQRLVPLAVAAAVILALAIGIAILPSGGERLVFPSAPLLRGSSGGPLHFPRERVLLPGPAAAELFPALGREIVFEIEPQDEAASYSVRLSRHEGDAFAVEGDALAELEGAAPTLRATLALEPGDYTWTARAEIRGLSRELGARDFAVAADAAIEARLAALRDQDEPERSLEAVRILHEAGYLADARAIARAMPASPDRDAYLGRVPGR